MAKKEMKLLEYEAPEMDENAKLLVAKLEQMGGTGVQTIQDWNKFLVALELFRPERLKMISDLDKEHIETLTRHDTLMDSAKLLFGLPDDAPMLKIVKQMGDSYLTYQISRSRKSRVEVVNILRNELMEQVRNAGDKLLGRK